MTTGKFLRLAFGIFFIAACTPSAPTPEAGEVQTVVAETFSAMTASAPPTSAPQTSPPTPPIVLEPKLTPGEQAHNTYFVETTAQNVNLRVGPGRLFPVSRVLAQGTRLEVTGLSRGGEWYYVVTAEGVIGWISGLFAELDLEGPPPPSVEPENATVVTGVVQTELGSPVSGIGFVITQGETSDPSEPRAEARTDDQGRFYAFMPSNLTGAWAVYYVSVSCTSNTMDANCNCKGGRCGEAHPNSVEITLPFAGELNFVWK